MENLHVKIEQVQGNELIIRQGEALPLSVPEKLRFSGDIKSVSNFLKLRTPNDYSHIQKHGVQGVHTDRSVVIVDKNKLYISLLIDPENEYGATVQGKLETSDELKVWGINTSQTYTREQLVKIIRFNKMMFASIDRHAEILAAYMAFSATANTDLQQSGDTRGNKANHFVKRVDTNIPTEFVLHIPIYKGEPVETFRVEICLEVTDGGARFWFESVELHELMQTRRDEIFQEVLKDCEGFVIINQ